MFYLSYKKHVQCDYVYHALYGSKVVKHENVFNVKSWTWEFEIFWSTWNSPHGKLQSI
jgi:hypothetical protein